MRLFLHVLHLVPMHVCAHKMLLHGSVYGDMHILCTCLHQCIVRHYSAVLRVKAGGHVNVQVSIVTQVMGASPQTACLLRLWRLV